MNLGDFLKHPIKTLPALALAAAALIQAPAYAIDTDPLDYVAPKAGIGVLGLYYGNWQSDKQYSKGSQVASNSIDLNYGVGTYVKFHDVAGYVVGTKIVVPVSHLKVSTPGGANVSGSGIGDPTFVFPVWLYSNAKTRTHFAITPRIQVPIGKYDKNAAINPGGNRYTFVLQPGFTTGLTEKISWDLVGDVQLFGKNDDIAGGGSLEQKALYSLQTHLTYAIKPGLEASIGAYKYIGGETKTRGVNDGNRTDTTTAIASLGYWATATDNFLVQYRSDTSVENGAKFNGIQLRYLHVF